MTAVIDIIWTDYMRYRAQLRGYDLDELETIVRYSSERYYDTVTNRLVVVGSQCRILVMIPYETDENVIVPITVHATTRQQINFRVRAGRFDYE